MRKQVSSPALRRGFTGFCLGLLLLAGGVAARAQVVEFLPVAPSVMEGSAVLLPDGSVGTNVSLIVTLTPALTNGTATVDFYTSDLTALSGTDYLTVAGTLTFSAGQNYQVITVPVLDNTIPQPARQFQVVLSNPQGAVLGTRSMLVATIFDDDAVYSLERSALVVNEGETNAVLNVQRVGGYGPGTVQFYTMDVPQAARDTNTPWAYAISGVDYLGGSGVVSFTNDQTTAQILIPIVDECLVESNETFLVFLTNAAGGSLGGRSSATVTIVDNDTGAGRFDFTATVDPGTIVSEGVGNVTFYVSRGCGNAGAVSVGWEVQYEGGNCPGGTRAQASDFTSPLAGTLTWGDRDSGLKSFSVGIANDGSVELDETFSVILRNPQNGAVLGTRTSHSVRILFDDQPAGAGDRTYDIASDYNPVPGANNTVQAVATYTNGPDAGKTVIGGEFTSVNSVDMNRLARLNGNGALDPSFNIGSGADGSVNAVVIQPADGKVLVAGGFSTLNNVSRNGIGRLNTNGSLDTAFAPGTGTDRPVYALALAPGGQVVMAGDFGVVNNRPRTRVARLQANGALDESFDPGLGPDDLVVAVAAQPDGRVILGGYFHSVSGTNLSYIARLLPDGSVDPSFTPVSGADGPVFALALEPDGGIILGGAFTSFDGVPRAGIARLNADGTLDLSFSACGGFDGPVYGLALQTDGRVVAVGNFTSYASTLRWHLVRLYGDGTLDTSFLDQYYNRLQPGTDGFVGAVALEADGDLIIGGGFSVLGGGFTVSNTLDRLNFARVIGGNNPPNENFAGNVEFVKTRYSVDENTTTGNVLVDVRRLYGYLGNVQVDYATSDGTAVAGRDYAARSGTLTFGACPARDTQLISIPVFDNAVADGNRTFTVTLSNPRSDLSTAKPALGVACVATVTILDNDFEHGVLSFSQPVYYVSEGSNYASVSVWRSNGANGTVSVQYQTLAGSALSPYDFAATSGTLTFRSGETNQDISIRIFDDTAMEGEEGLNLRLYNPGGGATLGRTNATLLILDNEAGTGSLSFSNLTYTVDEAGGVAAITLRRTSGSVGTVSAVFLTEDLPPGAGTARAGVDYTPVSNVVTFANGVLQQTVYVPIQDDGFVEGDEALRLRLLTPVGATLGYLSNATLTILENDFYGNLTFSQADYYINEQAGTAIITVTRTGGSAQDVSVDYAATAGNNAVDGVDFFGTSGRLIFTNGVISQSFSIGIVNDTALSGPKTVRLALSNFAKAGAGRFTNAVLTIVDDEALHVPAGSVDTYFNPNPGPSDVVSALAIQPSDGRVVVGGEFASFNNIGRNRLARVNQDGTLDLNFDPGAGANNTVSALALQDDEKVLIAGAFTRIGSTNRNHLARLTQIGQLDRTFDPGAGTDNPIYALAVQLDGLILIGGEFTTYNGLSRRGVARVNKDGSLDSHFNPGAGADGTVATLVLQDDGRILLGGDFTQFDSRPALGLARLNPDGSRDTNFNASMGGSSHPKVLSLVVQPDGRIVVAGSFTNVNGVARNRIARLNRDGSLDTRFDPGLGANAVVYAVGLQADGQLVLGGDFTLINGFEVARLARLGPNGAVNGGIDFGAGANDFVTTVRMQNDQSIVLAGAFTRVNGVDRRYLARLVGGDNTGEGFFQLESPAYTFSESDAQAVVRVVRKWGSGDMAEVDLISRDLTAVAGVHYQPLNLHLIFLEGETAKSIAIELVDDQQVGSARSFEVYLANPVMAQLGDQATASVDILDNDNRLEFVTPNYSVNEGVVGAQAIILVQRSGSTNSTVAVDFATQPGTALPGANYQPTNGTLVFGPGQMTQLFGVRVVDDALVGGPLGIGLALSNPRVLNDPYATAFLGLSNAVLTLLDNDHGPGVISFSNATFQVREDAGQAVISVVRTNGTSGVVRARLLTGGGTALAGSNYVAQDRIVSFADGETLKTVPIPILNDHRGVGDQTVGLRLQEVTGGAILGRTNALLTILEVDPVYGTFTFTNADSISMPEGTNAIPYPAIITVSNRPGILSNVTVTLVGVSHPAPAEMHALLVGPFGQSVLLMSDAGSSNGLQGLTLSFDDSASAYLPQYGQILSGLYKPTEYPPATLFRSPAPAGPYGAELFGFSGSEPNGDWRLYLMDVAGLANGAVTNGWRLTLTTVSPALGADLQVSQRVLPNPVYAGSNLTFSVTVTNAGPGNAGWVRLKDTYLGSVPLLSTNFSTGTLSNSGGVWFWEVGNLDAGEAATLELTLRAYEAGVFTNAASVRGSVPDPVPANNDNVTDAVMQANPAAADLVLSLTATPPTLRVRDTLTYTIQLTNRGPRAATGVVVTNFLPAGAQFVSASTSQGGSVNLGGAIYFSLGVLSNQAQATLTVVVVPRAVGTLTNSAVAAALEPDFSLNQATVLTLVTPSADLAVSVTDVIDPVGVGGTVTYNVIAFNNGPSDAPGVSVFDHLPPQAVFDTATVSQGSVSNSGGTVVVSFGTIPNGGSAVMVLKATVQSPAVAMNLASVASEAYDPNWTNNLSTCATTFLFGIGTGLGIIDNGTVQLGVHAAGHLNVAGGEPSSGTGTTYVGLRYMPTKAESTAPGCLCEGWGVADNISKVAGFANEAMGGIVNLLVESFSADGVTARSTVRVSNTFRVTHDYHPIAATPNLYQVDVTIENISTNTTHPLYRRVMDWDVEPTAFREYSTMQKGNSPFLVFTSDNGFASANPLSGPSSILATGDFVDSGPADHGALFDFDFGLLAPGEVRQFKTYYGAAGTEEAANRAIASVGAEAYSYGQPSTSGGPTLGTPNTFIFAFGGIGGSALFGADLAIASSAAPSQVVMGEELTFTISLTNRGPEVATAVRLTNQLPPNVSIVTAGSSAGAVVTAGDRVMLRLDSLAAGARATLTIVVIPTAEGLITNRVSVSADQVDGNQDNNESLAIARVLTTGTFSNPGLIEITDATPARPYPSTNRVTGLDGVVSKVMVTLVDVTHPYPADIDVLLVNPAGQAVILMSDAGESFGIDRVTLKFTDDSTNLLPAAGQILSGLYRPSNYDFTGPDPFYAPAPAGPYGASLAAFNGSDPNGEWRLFVVDDQGSDAGWIYGGWQLTLATTNASAPSLAIRRSGAGYEVSWPSYATQYVLEASPALGLGASWSPVVIMPDCSAGRCRVTVPAAPGSQFFRLRHQ